MKRWHKLLNDPKLRQMSTLPFDEAMNIALNFFGEVYFSFPSQQRELFPNTIGTTQFQEVAALADDLDRQYLDYEEAGDLIKSAQLFSAARYAFACRYLLDATTSDDLFEAVYEASHARSAASS